LFKKVKKKFDPAALKQHKKTILKKDGL